MNDMSDLDLARQVLADDGPDDLARERARARLRHHIRAADRQHERRKRGWALAAAAALTVVLAVVATFRSGGPAAAEMLRALGARAQAAPGPRLQPGEFLLSTAKELRPETFSQIGGTSFTVVSLLHVQTWMAADGSGYRRTEVLSSSFASAEDQQAWADAGSSTVPQAGDVRSERFEPGQAPWYDLNTLPTDPDRLLAVLRAQEMFAHPPGDAEIFLLIGDLLAQGDASPSLAAALFNVAADLGGVQHLGLLQDPLGRRGEAFSVSGEGLVVVLIFDPSTAALLSSERFPPGSDVRTAQAESWRAFLPVQVTSSWPGETRASR